MRFDIHIYIHNETETIHLLNKILRTMITKADFDAAIAQINDATNNIADDITRLTAQLGSGGLTADEQQAVLDQLNSTAARLKEIAAVTPEPTQPEQPAA